MIPALIKKTPEVLSLPPFGDLENTAIYEPENELLLDTEFADFLIWTPILQNCEKQISVIYKSHSLWCFCYWYFVILLMGFMSVYLKIQAKMRNSDPPSQISFCFQLFWTAYESAIPA